MGSVNPYITAGGERRWEVFFRDETHRQHHKRGFETRKAARAYLAAHEVAVENGEYIDPKMSKITVGGAGHSMDRGAEGNLEAVLPEVRGALVARVRQAVLGRPSDRRHQALRGAAMGLRTRTGQVGHGRLPRVRHPQRHLRDGDRGQADHQNTHGAHDAASKDAPPARVPHRGTVDGVG